MGQFCYVWANVVPVCQNTTSDSHTRMLQGEVVPPRLDLLQNDAATASLEDMDISSSDESSSASASSNDTPQDSSPTGRGIASVTNAISELIRLSNIVYLSARESRKKRAAGFLVENAELAELGDLSRSYLQWRYRNLPTFLHRRLIAANRQRRRRLLYEMHHQRRLRPQTFPVIYDASVEPVLEADTTFPESNPKSPKRERASEVPTRPIKISRMASTVSTGNRTDASTARDSQAQKLLSSTIFSQPRAKSIIENQWLSAFPPFPGSSQCPICGSIFEFQDRSDVAWR